MNIKKLVGAGIVAGAVAVSSLGAAGAAVTIDSEGHGFVGKGDVKFSTELTEAQIQAGVAVNFTSKSTEDFEVVCEKEEEISGGNMGNDKLVGKAKGKSKVTRVDEQDVTESVAREVDSKGRTNPRGKITGYNLNGFIGLIVSTGLPEVGDLCDGVDEVTLVAFTGGTVTSVEAIPDSASGPVFYVNGVLLKEAPVL